MYAVIGSWTMDPTLVEQGREVLLTRIVPGVRQTPGLVKGYWSGNADSTLSHTFIVFDNLTAAESFAEDVRGNTANQSANGLGLVDLNILEVVAET